MSRIQAFATTIPAKFQQGSNLTCLVDSFANALDRFGCPTQANLLHEEGLKRLNATDVQVIRSTHNFISKMFKSQFNMVSLHETVKSIPDLFTLDDSWPVMVLLGSEDGASKQHAVAMCRGVLFDSNAPYALTKTQEALDWCTGDTSKCDEIPACYQLRPKLPNHWKNRMPPVASLPNHGFAWLITSSKKSKITVQFFTGVVDSNLSYDEYRHYFN